MKQLVLVVDDDDNMRRVVTEALRDDGYKVMTAHNGAEALAYAQRDHQRLDLVLLDLRMPVMDGWTFLRECRSFAWCNDMPVVVLSAEDGFQTAGEELAGNVHATLGKPFDVGMLLAIAGRITGHRSGTGVVGQCSRADAAPRT